MISFYIHNMRKEHFINNFFLSIFTLFLVLLKLNALPLSTNTRWIVDEKGQRVKLACVNWVAHLELVVAEGLTKQPVDLISKKIKEMGFNCVRLTWPLYLATNRTLSSLTVRESFVNAGLCHYIGDLKANNPSIVDLSLIDAFQEVVASLARNKVMVILDNHISKPGWCCAETDGNGFFGDKYFNPQQWINGLVKMATLFQHNPYVVGMSLRNELRGPRQNPKDWYRYMQKGAEVVHRANPNILVILSGLYFDTDLTFLNKQLLNLSFTKKLVLEVHHYSFGEQPPLWKATNADEACGKMTSTLMKKVGFLIDQGFPLFVSEWGINVKDTSVSDTRYLNCFLAWLAQHDLDWALWTLVGSYYVNRGEVGQEEFFGVLDSNWTQVRDQRFLQKISVVQSPLQGPGLTTYNNHHKLIYHPLTGLCILKKPIMGVKLGNCTLSNHWDYTPQKTLIIKYSYFCLKAQGLNRPARLSIICPGTGTIWAPLSDSKLHLATTLGDNSRVCLDVDANNNLVTTTCKCLSKDVECDPESQWFKIVDA